jgi:hypothetical protein
MVFHCPTLSCCQWPMISLQADDVGKSNPDCCCGCVVVRRRAGLAQTSVYLVLSACSLLPLHIISFLHLLLYTTIYAGSCWCHLQFQHRWPRQLRIECRRSMDSAQPTSVTRPASDLLRSRDPLCTEEKSLLSGGPLLS